MIAGLFNKRKVTDLKPVSQESILLSIQNAFDNQQFGKGIKKDSQKFSESDKENYLVFSSQNDRHQIGFAISDNNLLIVYKLKTVHDKSSEEQFVIREQHSLPDTQAKLNRFIKKQSGTWKRFLSYRKPPIEGLKKLTV